MITGAVDTEPVAPRAGSRLSVLTSSKHGSGDSATLLVVL